MMNFVFVSLQPIGTDRDSTSTSLAKELAKKHNVLYVNPPIDRKTLHAKEKDKYTLAHIENIKSGKKSLVKLQDKLWALYPTSIIESINWLPFTFVFKQFNYINNSRFAQDIKKAIAEVGFEDFILVNDKDIFRSFYLKEILNPSQYIYLDRDYTLGVPYWRKHGLSMEPELMQKSDAVVCNSIDFTERAKKYNPKSYYIGNGFNDEQFVYSKQYDCPADLKEIPGPIIGYVGALLSLRLDLGMLEQMAVERPNWSIVLIGWEDDDFSKSILHKLPNVYFLGKKHTEEVPAYVRYFDVCINPQIINEITRYNFPLKVVEYLALGKAVVATATNTMNQIFSQQTYLAEGTHDFISKVELALQEDKEELQIERVEFSKKFRWSNVANLFLEGITGEVRNKELQLS